jgi:hypothetical protein
VLGGKSIVCVDRVLGVLQRGEPVAGAGSVDHVFVTLPEAHDPGVLPRHEQLA